MPLRYRGLRHPAAQLRDEMDRLLSGFLGHPSEGSWTPGSRGQPAVNLWEQGDTLMAELEVPGVTPEQLDISVVGGELTLRVDRQIPAEEGLSYHRRERPTGSFTRVLRLPADVDGNRVQAELKDGILTITLPKAEGAKPRKIEIASAS